MDEHELLIDHFVGSFGRFDELSFWKEINPIAWQLRTGETDEVGRSKWRPEKVITDNALLEPLYAKLPARFPVLYERLVLSYRWAEVGLKSYRLLANPPGPDLAGLLNQMSHAPAFWASLLPAGYIQFGRGPDMDYDPVCFEVKSRKKNYRECRIVKIDHEEILCRNRVKVVAELAPSFEGLVRNTVSQAQR